MAFEVQDPDVPTETANAYISVAYFKAYADDRGINYSAKTDTDIEQAIVRATDYMDGRWTYAGNRYDDDQSTEVPRRNVWNKDGTIYLDYFPIPFEDACAEYTKIDLIDGLSLMPNAVDNTVPGQLTYLRTRVEGAVEKEQHFNSFKGYGGKYPSWPLPDKMMQRTGLLASSRRTLGRG
jgi:hypothetical protein